jgi:hypothetical protein
MIILESEVKQFIFGSEYRPRVASINDSLDIIAEAKFSTLFSIHSKTISWKRMVPPPPPFPAYSFMLKSTADAIII